MHQSEGTSQKPAASPLPGSILKTSLERDKRGVKPIAVGTLHPRRAGSGGPSVHVLAGGSQGHISGSSSNQNIPATAGFLHIPVTTNLSSGASSRHISGAGKKGLTRVISSPGIPSHSQNQRKKKTKKPAQVPGRSSCEPGVKKSNSRNSMVGPRAEDMKHSSRRAITRESGRYLDGDNSAPLIKVTLGEEKGPHKGPKKSVLKAFFEGVKSDSAGVQSGKGQRVPEQNELQLRHSKSRPVLLAAEALGSKEPHSTSLQAKALGVLKRRIKSEQFGEEHPEPLNLLVTDVVNGHIDLNLII